MPRLPPEPGALTAAQQVTSTRVDGHIIVLMNRPLLESDAADVVGAAGETADVAEPDADPARPVGTDSDTAARAGAEPVVTVLDRCLAATTSTKIATIATCTPRQITRTPGSGVCRGRCWRGS
jgi:hypothetical protein